jgi:hypothetical protein
VDLEVTASDLRATADDVDALLKECGA